MYKILCIGSCCKANRNVFSGQSIMFDGLVKYFKENNFFVEVVDISPKSSKNSVLYRSMDYVAIFAEFYIKLIRGKYDLIYITTSQGKNGFLRDKVMITLAKWFQIPVITHQYGANYQQLLDSIGDKRKSSLKNMLEYVSAIIVEGDYMKKQFSFLPNYENKIKVIPNGLPIEGKNSQNPKEYDVNQPFKMFYLSNLIWSKGYFDVLRAVDILVNQEKLNVRCVFAGRFMNFSDDEIPGSSNKDNFDIFIKEHHLQERVEYFPGLFGEEKDKYFFETNVFLLPTYYINEGQPVSIIEAMAYGCVPIVTEYRHIPMMINEKNGCFVKPKDAEDIAKKVKYLIEHPDEYAAKSRQSIADYKEKFKFEVYVGKVMDCINSVIS